MNKGNDIVSFSVTLERNNKMDPDENIFIIGYKTKSDIADIALTRIFKKPNETTVVRIDDKFDVHMDTHRMEKKFYVWRTELENAVSVAQGLPPNRLRAGCREVTERPVTPDGLLLVLNILDKNDDILFVYQRTENKVTFVSKNWEDIWYVSEVPDITESYYGHNLVNNISVMLRYRYFDR